VSATPRRADWFHYAMSVAAGARIVSTRLGSSAHSQTGLASRASATPAEVQEVEEVLPAPEGDSSTFGAEVQQEDRLSDQGAQEDRLSDQGAQEVELSDQGAQEDRLSDQGAQEVELSDQGAQEVELEPTAQQSRTAAVDEQPQSEHEVVRAAAGGQSATRGCRVGRSCTECK